MHFQQGIKYLPDNFKSFFCYPMLMIGKTDMAKAYNPYGISLCLTEMIMPFGLSLPEKC